MMSLDRDEVFDESTYAQACSRYRRPTERALRRYLAVLARLIGQPPLAHPLVLDAGCGAGAFTLPLARLARARDGHTIALDRSPAMLDVLLRSLTRGDAEQLVSVRRGDVLSVRLPRPCALIWASDVLHAIADLDAFFRSAARLLRPGGAVAVRMSSHAQLRSDEWGAYFPEAMSIDLRAHHDTGAVCAALERNGFRGVDVREIDESRWMPTATYVGLFEARSLSSLRLITDAQFAAGMRRMRQAYEGRTQTFRRARTTLISAKWDEA
jgi:SAM-dependent methyltransferase